jgi:hypothetical protein
MIELTLTDAQLDHVTQQCARTRRGTKMITVELAAVEAMLVDYGALCRAVPHDVPLTGGPSKMKRRSP